MSAIVVAMAVSLGAGGAVIAQESGALDANKPPQGVLPLPAVGAELGIFYKQERPTSGAPKVDSKVGDITIKAFTATAVKDPYSPRDRMQVDVALSKPARDHYVDVYVSGYYVGLNGNLEGLANVGRRPAYEFVRLGALDQNTHPAGDPNRRFTFRAPDVFPAKLRAELYQIKQPKPARLVAIKEAVFDVGWKDYGLIAGYLFGDKQKGYVSGYAFLALPETTSIMVTIPAATPGDSSNNFGISVRLEPGQTEVRNTTYNRTIGRPVNWKGTVISVNPWLTDRDIRNNLYWPHIKNGGYLDIPPIRSGSLPPYP